MAKRRRRRKSTPKKRKKTGCKIIRLGKGKGTRCGCYTREGLWRFRKKAVCNIRRRKAG